MKTVDDYHHNIAKKNRDEAHRQGMARVRLTEDAQVQRVREALIEFLEISINGLHTISVHFQKASRANCYIGNKIRQLQNFDLEE